MERKLVITTARNPLPEEITLAQKAAEDLAGRYIPRTGHITIRKMQKQYGVHQILTVGDRLTFYMDDQAIFFHPSMSVVRIKRMLAGEPDTAVEKSRICPGDSVLDCTLGMGADAIVFAHAVGPSGKVVGIEQSRILSFLVRDGLQRWQSDMPQLENAMRRVKVIAGDHLNYMKHQTDQSFDIVYFDPMFRNTVKESVNFDPVRSLSLADPISHDAIREACRIARKAVVLKERIGGGEFERLGFPPPSDRSSSFTYSVMDMQEEHKH